ncbi:MAG: hypothetical protein GWO24_12395 [Akkermansiaceae bacterium]|nr:hypothetical protein [Akkermansiaceae bacterium]
MDSLVHPTQLSVWQRFLQARRLQKETSRSKNLDWYRSALDLDNQLHLFLEGDGVSAAHLCCRGEATNKWTSVPSPSPEMDEEALGEYLTTLKADFPGTRVRSLGVVLHLADEFAISELANATERPEDYGDLSRQLIVAPQEVVGGRQYPVDRGGFLPALSLPRCETRSSLRRGHHDFPEVSGLSSQVPVHR